MQPDHEVALALHGKATGGRNNGCVPELNQKGATVLYTLAVILLILWLLGMVGSYTLGGLIHILLVVALVMIVVNLVSGRRAL